MRAEAFVAGPCFARTPPFRPLGTSPPAHNQLKRMGLLSFHPAQSLPRRFTLDRSHRRLPRNRPSTSHPSPSLMSLLIIMAYITTVSVAATVPSPSPTASPVIALAASAIVSGNAAAHTCLLSSSGGLTCWGLNTYGQLGNGGTTSQYSPSTVNVLANVSSVALGSYHTCVVMVWGGLRCWGWNYGGQLGNASIVSPFALYSPSTTDVLTNVAVVSVGQYHTCALMTWAGVRCWGSNTFGQLGNGDSSGATVYSPPQSDVLVNVSAITSGSSHVCALLVWSGVRCWGNNANGQLGTGTIVSLSSPSAYDAITSVTAISAGGSHTCVVMTRGGARCWGSNAFGQLGIGSTVITQLNNPPSVDAVWNVSAIAAGGSHTCAVMAWGGVRCWGNGTYGQLGSGGTSAMYSPPLFDILTGATSVTAGTSHTCAAMADGGYRCWGYNSDGECGNGGTVNVIAAPSVDASSSLSASATPSPSPTPSLTPTQSVSPSYSITPSYTPSVSPTTSLTMSMSVSTSVSPSPGSVASVSPTPSPSGQFFSIVSSEAANHTCAVISGGGLSCWGANVMGQLGNGNTVQSSSPSSLVVLTSVVSVSVGSAHSCAVMSWGGVRCWGDNTFGQLNNASATGIVLSPLPNDIVSNATAVSCGYYHTCVVYVWGNVSCWGGNMVLSSASMPSSTTVGVSSGGDHACVLSAAGGVRCWGWNGYGQLGTGTTVLNFTFPSTDIITGVSSIATGYAHTCVLLSTGGSVVCWGSNQFGQLGNGDVSGSSVLAPPSYIVLTGTTTVSAGYGHTCALMAWGGVRCWGLNANGQLGTGGNTTLYSPPVSDVLIGVSSVTAGYSHTCALMTDGGFRCWGGNSNGQLGNGLSSSLLSPPIVDISPSISVTISVSISVSSSVSRTATHTATSSASASYLSASPSLSKTMSHSITPTLSTSVGSSATASPSPSPSGQFAAIVSGEAASHTCAITNYGGLRCFGANLYGQLGTGGTTRLYSPPVTDTLQFVSAVTAGQSHTCVLMTWGGVKCWGYNSNGQLGNTSVPIGGTLTSPSGTDILPFVAAVTAGQDHTCVLMSWGGVRCWGSNTYGQCGNGDSSGANVLSPPNSDVIVNVIAVAAAGHTCVLMAWGGVRCWGLNANGQLGNGGTANVLSPPSSDVIANVSAIALGGSQTCVLMIWGGVRCWGYNSYGQLGNGGTTQLNSPPVADVITAVTAVAAGTEHTCALLSWGGVRCWGLNSNGQLGNGGTANVLSPPVSDVVTGVAAISAGLYHTCALMIDGGFRCWGSNSLGQLGNGTTTGGQLNSPPSFDTSSSVSSTISVSVTISLTPSGTPSYSPTVSQTASVTSSASSSLSMSSSLGCSPSFTPLPSPSGQYAAIVTSEAANHTCAITSYGGLRCWGNNAYGQLGNGVTSQIGNFSITDVLTNVSAVSVGSSHTCALMTWGGVRCWGYNIDGECGLFGISNASAPSNVDTFSTAVSVSVGAFHTCVLTSSGGARCWGLGSSGQLGNGGTFSVYTVPSADIVFGVSALSAGANHTCVLMVSGGVRCWGSNTFGQLGNGGTASLFSVPTVDVLSSVASIAAGGSHSCVVMTWGGVRCWGNNVFGQLGNGDVSGISVLSPPVADSLSNVSVVSAGYGHTCVLMVWNGVRCWGLNVNGQLGNNGTTTLYSPPVSDVLIGVTRVTSGNSHTCALMMDSGFRCWGGNGNAQLGNGPPPISVFSPPLMDAIPVVLASSSISSAPSISPSTSITATPSVSLTISPSVSPTHTVSIGSTPSLTPSPSSSGQYAAVVSSLAAYHTCAITSYGGLRCWGYNAYGQLGNGDASGSNIGSPPTVDVLNNVASVALGQDHTCGVLASGGVRCWGWNLHGQLGNGDLSGGYTLSPPSSDVLEGVSSISCGNAHTCALMMWGSVRCWGANTYGQLGTGGTASAFIVPSTDVLVNVSSIAAGIYHTCALMSWGGERCWGYGVYGQLGNGGTGVVLSPPSADVISNVSAIAAGGFHSCALMSWGGVRCWGDNASGQLGNGGVAQVNSPPTYDVITSAVAIVCGVAHTCALMAWGGVRCWGAGASGQLGTGTTTQLSSPPVADVLTGVAAIAAGYDHTCALMSAGSFRCWGLNAYGQLGSGSTSGQLNAPPVVDTSPSTSPSWAFTPFPSLTPTVSSLPLWVSVSSSVGASPSVTPSPPPKQYVAIVSSQAAFHTCAITSYGGLRCWGLGTSGQLGNGVSTSLNSPLSVDVLTSVAAVSVGSAHTCALMAWGGVRCWGLNSYGQLGFGGTATVLTPPPVDVIGNASAVSCGSSHTCALMTWGGVRCWGYNGHGELGNGTSIPGRVYSPPSVDTVVNVSLVSCGNFHTCVLMVWGGVRCWGYNGQGQAGSGGDIVTLLAPPTSDVIQNATSLAIGSSHTCVTMAWGGVRCWGYNAFGQLGNGGTLAVYSPPAFDVILSVAAIASGGSHTCALMTWSGLRCWGSNSNGQLGNGTGSGQLNSPPASDVLTGVSAVTAGNTHTCALMLDGGIRCWGYNGNGQLGNGSSSGQLNAPASYDTSPSTSISPSSTPVPSFTGSFSPVATASLSFGSSPTLTPAPSPSGQYVAIVSGSAANHTCVITSSGGLRCWGANTFGQLGNGDTSGGTVWNVPSVDVMANVRAVVVGAVHTCVLTVAGGVRCWGYGAFGQLGSGNTVQVYAPPSTDVLTSAASITAGWYHSCVVMTWGGARCWGSNVYGQLGNGGNTNVTSPPRVDVISNVSAITAGYAHTCTLMQSGGVRCWGYSSFGQLGNGLPGSILYSPPAYDMLSNVSAISAGSYHTCAVMVWGGVRCWGSNTHFQLGNGDGTGSQVNSVPVVDALPYVSSISTGSVHSCAVMNWGGVRCWGSNTVGELGTGAGNIGIFIIGYPPADVLSSAVSVTCGQSHTCALMSDGGIRCWGGNDFGQLGNGGASQLNPPSVDASPSITGSPSSTVSTTATSSATPSLTLSVAVTPSISPSIGSSTSPTPSTSPSSQYAAIVSGNSALHTCALTGYGGLRCWGYNSYGQLGTGNSLQANSTPTSDVLTGVAAVSVGYGHTCAVMVWGGTRCWGWGVYGQLGSGASISLSSPPGVDVLANVTAVSVGGLHNCAVMTWSGLRCWGSNSVGQLGNGGASIVYSPPSSDALRNVSSVVTGYSHTCVLLSWGGVRCWGSNSFGQLGNGDSSGASVLSPPGVDTLVSVIAVSAGQYHTCALMSWNGVRCWGNNAHGELGNGNTNTVYSPPPGDVLSSVRSIAAGGIHSCVVMVWGSVRCWGGNWNGQLGTGNTLGLLSPPGIDILMGVSAVATGLYHTCVLMVDGGIRCWGSDYNGQLGDGGPAGDVFIPPVTDLSPSISVTSSVTGSVSWTATTSPSASITASDSGSVSVSASATCTSTSTSTTTSTVSVTNTASPTSTSTVSMTSSASLTRSVSRTASLTATLTLTGSPSGSLSESSTLTRSGTVSVSVSATVTESITLSKTLTPTVSVTSTGTTTMTDTATPSNSPSYKSSRTPTGSLTATGSRTLSGTVSSSSTKTVSSTVTATQTASSTVSVTATDTRTVSRTPSDSPSVSPTSTDTPTPSTSAVISLAWVNVPDDPTSVISGEMEFGVANDYLIDSLELFVDDDPVNITVNSRAISYGPLSPGSHNLTLTAVGSYGGIVSLHYDWTIAVNFIDVVPVSGNILTVSNQLFAHVDQFSSKAVLSFSLPQPPAASESVTVICASNDSSVGVVVSGPALVSGPPIGNTLVLSGVPYYYNDGPLSRPFAVRCRTVSVLPSYSTVKPVYQNALVRAVTGACNRTLWPLFQDVLVLSDEGLWVSSLSGASFSLTVSKNVTALIIGDVMFRSRGQHFTSNTSVRVGAIPAIVVNYSSDVRPLLESLSLPGYASATWNAPIDALWVVFPGYNTSCVSGNGDDSCGSSYSNAYKTVTLSNPGAGSVSCPPLCPGVTDTVIGGVFYSARCAGYNTTGAACLDPATAHLCALGSGDTCQACPIGGICPGGNRLWPQPGYWTVSETSLSLQACAYPATARCVGWSTSIARTVCGVGYSDPFSGCASCASKYFPELGACFACPVSSSHTSEILLLFAMGLFLAFAVVVGIALGMSKVRGGSMGSAIFRGRDFVTWAMVTWQSIIQVSKRVSAAPPLVRSVFSAISILELDSSAALHPACYSRYPFTLQLMEFIGSLITVGVVTACFAIPVSKWKQFATLRRMGMTILTLLYPLVCNSSLTMLNCVHNSSGSLVLASNPSFTCYEGDHLRVGVLAWFVLFLHVIGFPLASFITLWRKGPRIASALPSFVQTWAMFIAIDFKPHFFWFVHLNCGSVFVLSLLLVFIPPTASIGLDALAFIITTLVVFVNIGCQLKYQPFQGRRQWKQPVKLVALTVTEASAVANLVCAAYAKGLTGSEAADGFAFLTLGLICVLVVCFLAQFWRVTWRDASRGGANLLKKHAPVEVELPAVNVVDPTTESFYVVNPMAARIGRGGGRGDRMAFGPIVVSTPAGLHTDAKDVSSAPEQQGSLRLTVNSEASHRTMLS